MPTPRMLFIGFFELISVGTAMASVSRHSDISDVQHHVAPCGRVFQGRLMGCSNPNEPLLLSQKNPTVLLSPKKPAPPTSPCCILVKFLYSLFSNDLAESDPPR